MVEGEAVVGKAEVETGCGGMAGAASGAGQVVVGGRKRESTGSAEAAARGRSKARAGPGTSAARKRRRAGSVTDDAVPVLGPGGCEPVGPGSKAGLGRSERSEGERRELGGACSSSQFGG